MNWANSSMVKAVFFRNDGVGLFSGSSPSPELVNFTEVFISEEVPISHSVVPKLVSEETVRWLREKKTTYPGLISIGQHGFRHVKNDVGEFGGKLGYQDQKDDIVKGYELMERHFGADFSPWFAPPWVKYNRNTKKICDELGYRIFSGGVSPRLVARVFNGIGRMMRLNVMGGKEVSYHRRGCFTQWDFDILEVSVGIDVVLDYKQRELKSVDDIVVRFRECEKHFDAIGFMLHQWVFDDETKLDLLRKLFSKLRAQNSVQFCLIEDVPSISGANRTP